MSEAKQLVSSVHQADEDVARAVTAPETGLRPAATKPGLESTVDAAQEAVTDERANAAEVFDAEHVDGVPGAVETDPSNSQVILTAEDKQLNPARPAPARPLRPGLHKGLRPGLST